MATFENIRKQGYSRIEAICSKASAHLKGEEDAPESLRAAKRFLERVAEGYGFFRSDHLLLEQGMETLWFAGAYNDPAAYHPEFQAVVRKYAAALAAHDIAEDCRNETVAFLERVSEGAHRKAQGPPSGEYQIQCK